MMYKFTEEQMLEAIKDTRGVVQDVARRLNIHHVTARDWINKYPAAVEALRYEFDRLTDDALRTVRRAVNDDDVGTAKWVLSRRRPDDWAPKSEVKHKGQINFNFGDDVDVKKLVEGTVTKSIPETIDVEAIEEEKKEEIHDQ